MDEFELIRKFFTRDSDLLREDVRVGIGDDAAVCCPPAGQDLVFTTDLLLEGVHFPKGTAARDIGHKALAVNLSDLAAMGATPLWFTLSLSLPEANTSWLADLAAGLFDLADTHNIALVGGDTVRGPLSIGIQATGAVPEDAALLRSGAQAGDAIYVTGSIGDAAAGLMVARDGRSFSEATDAFFVERLNRPTPRVEVGQALRGVASAAIDISDGLAADLGHICERSDLGARIIVDDMPLSEAYRDVLAVIGAEPALTGGDDYELCFTVPVSKEAELAVLVDQLGCPMTRIGEMVAGSALEVVDAAGQAFALHGYGHVHFSKSDETNNQEAEK